MDRKPERKGEPPEAMRALNRELFTAIAEFQEEKRRRRLTRKIEPTMSG